MEKQYRGLCADEKAATYQPGPAYLLVNSIV
jgi:hypothetical protein